MAFERKEMPELAIEEDDVVFGEEEKTSPGVAETLQKDISYKTPKQWVYDMLSEFQDYAGGNGIPLFDRCTAHDLANFTKRYKRVWANDS
jgi:hypothetical protein